MFQEGTVLLDASQFVSQHGKTMESSRDDFRETVPRTASRVIFFNWEYTRPSGLTEHPDLHLLGQSGSTSDVKVLPDKRVCEALQELANRMPAELFWMSGHSDINGNERAADQLDRNGASANLIGLKLAVGFSLAELSNGGAIDATGSRNTA